MFLYSSRTLLISLFASLPNSPRSTESSERELSTRAPVAQECIKKFVYILITCTQMAKARCWPMQHGLAYLFDRAVTDRDPALAMRKGEKFAGYCPGRGCLLHPTTQSDGHTLALQDPKVSTDTHNNTSELNHMAILWLKRPSMLHVISRTLELSKSQQHTMPNMHVQQHEVRVGTYRTLPWNARVVVAALGGRAGTSFKAASASISSRETRTASSVLPKDMLKLVDSLEGQTGPQVCWPKGQEDWSLPASLNRALFTNETSYWYQDPGVSRCAR